MYVVWMTPRTKVCELTTASEKRANPEDKNQAQKRDVAFDQLEVGDHVEIQFAAQRGNGRKHRHSSKPTHLAKQVRHRMFSGYANSITILPSRSEDHSASGSTEKPNEIPKCYRRIG